jgi:lysyl-tRNA synthetase class I
MTPEYSASELIDFMEYLADKNLLNTSTAKARKFAVIKVLNAVDENEKTDLRNLDKEVLFRRFTNKFGKELTPDSLRTYTNRYNLALNHFLEYKQNPATFKIGPSKKSAKDNNTGKKTVIKKPSSPTPEIVQTNTFLEPKSYVLQIPISDGRLIEIRNLPMDLSESDARKIAAIITAHVPKEG